MARILIVDDEAAIRLLLTAILSREGFHIHTASDGAEAMTICSTEPFDLVLSDVMMPEMDGHKLAQWVAESYPSTKTALMSGYDTGCRGCLYSPRCKILAKPFEARAVVSFVRGILGSSEAPLGSPTNLAG
jgi:DNA-binding NtrC family response regulator